MHPSAGRVNRDGAQGAESVLMIPPQFPAGRDLGQLAAHVVVMNRRGFPLEVTPTITLTSAFYDDLITAVSHGRRGSQLHGRDLLLCTTDSNTLLYIRYTSLKDFK